MKRSLWKVHVGDSIACNAHVSVMRVPMISPLSIIRLSLNELYDNYYILVQLRGMFIQQLVKKIKKLVLTLIYIMVIMPLLLYECQKTNKKLKKFPSKFT